MKKRFVALCLLFTMVFSVGATPVLADELEEYLEELSLGDIEDDGISALAEEELTWEALTSMPNRRVNAATSAVGEKIYLIGGSASDVYNVVAPVDIYNTATDTWATGASLEVPRSRMISVSYKDSIYAFGGYTRTNVKSTSTDIYDTATDTWRSGANMPRPRDGGTAVVYNDEIYVIGGILNGGASPALPVDVYNPQEDSWRTVSSSSGANLYHAATAYDGKIFTLQGGLNYLRIYDIDSDSWTNSSNAPGSVGGQVNTQLIGDKIYTFGSTGIYIYDINNDTWDTGISMPASSTTTTSAYVDGKLYVFLQQNGTVYSLRVQEGITPPSTNRLYVLLNISESVQLSLSHNLGINLNYDWSSTDDGVATVNANGYVTAEGEGVCFIYAENEEGYSDYIPIKVIEGNADEIRLAVHLTIGGTARLYLAEDPTDVNWTSFDDSVVSVDDAGLLTANGRGLAIVQGEIDGKEYHIYVRVNA